MTEKSKNVASEKIFLMEYREVGDFIRHYSSVRAALTAFLFALGLAAFVVHILIPGPLYLPLVAGHFLVISAMAVCLIFSYRTERANLYLRALWKWFHGQVEEEPSGYKNASTGREVYLRMARDPMNWLLLIGAALFLSVFWFFDWK